MRPQHSITFPRNLHPGAWWLWAIGLAAAATRTQNPVPLLLILAVAGLVVSARRSTAPWAKSYGAFLKLAVLIIAIRVAFQALLSTGSQGPTVLFTLPSLPMPPDSGLKLGGEVTLEAVLQAFYEGLQLGVILCCVGAANALGSARRLLRYVPGALYEIGVACVIALTFAPQLVADAQRVRAAHRLRGRSTRGLGSLVRLAMPVLEGALEHSVELAAAMDSRGYGRTTDTERVSRRLTAVLVFGGLLGVCVGVYGLLDGTTSSWLGLPMLLAGSVARDTRRHRRRTPHRPHEVPPRRVGAARVARHRLRGGRRRGGVRERPDRPRADVPRLGHDGAPGAAAGLCGHPGGGAPGRAGASAARRTPDRDPDPHARRGGGRMITFDGVGIRFVDAPRPVLEGVDLTIPEGELALVVGRTGSGKTTLLRAINGLVPHFTGGTLTGRVVVDGRDTREHRPRDLADVVGYVGQDPVSGFVTDTVEDELAYGMESLGLPADVMRKRVEETLDLLGLADLRHRPLASLSGGQQQRVAIGSVLTTHPRILVLDEPTSALDPVAAEEVLATLQRLVHDLGLTVRARRAPARAGRAVRRPRRPRPRRRPARGLRAARAGAAGLPRRTAGRRARPDRRLVAAAAVGPRRPPPGRPAARAARGRRRAGPLRHTGRGRRRRPSTSWRPTARSRRSRA